MKSNIHVDTRNTQIIYVNGDDEMFLYHYFERDFGPFRSFAELPIEEAREILIARKAAGKIGNPNIEGFLTKRYAADKRLYDAFIGHGGQPKRKNPIYFFLGEHRQWATAYENPMAIKIPLSEFDPLTVSFTYGDSFAIFNPALFGDEEYWNRVYFADEIIELIERIGWPPHVDYDFKRGIFPKDKHINDCLLHVEAHVWDDKILDKYRKSWLANITE